MILTQDSIFSLYIKNFITIIIIILGLKLVLCYQNHFLIQSYPITNFLSKFKWNYFIILFINFIQSSL